MVAPYATRTAGFEFDADTTRPLEFGGGGAFGGGGEPLLLLPQAEISSATVEIKK
jgi:hypothetical protein